MTDPEAFRRARREPWTLEPEYAQALSDLTALELYSKAEIAAFIAYSVRQARAKALEAIPPTGYRTYWHLTGASINALRRGDIVEAKRILSLREALEPFIPEGVAHANEMYGPDRDAMPDGLATTLDASTARRADAEARLDATLARLDGDGA